MRRIVAVGLLCSGLVTLAFAADFWDQKPYSSWSSKEVRQLLSDSPWAKTMSFRQSAAPAQGRGRSIGIGTTDTDNLVSYTVYVRTAQPAREALARSAQLVQKYEQMDNASRQAFDAKWNRILAAGPADKIIFNVTYSANPADLETQLARYWQAQTLESIATSASMTGPDGKRLAPIAFWVASGAGREFQLAFPRPQGELPQGATLILDFQHAQGITNERGTAIQVKFTLADMLYKGALTY